VVVIRGITMQAAGSAAREVYPKPLTGPIVRAVPYGHGAVSRPGSTRDA
jgi:hypothetical protein